MYQLYSLFSSQVGFKGFNYIIMFQSHVRHDIAHTAEHEWGEMLLIEWDRDEIQIFLHYLIIHWTSPHHTRKKNYYEIFTLHFQLLDASIRGMWDFDMCSYEFDDEIDASNESRMWKNVFHSKVQIISLKVKVLLNDQNFGFCDEIGTRNFNVLFARKSLN